MNNEIFSFLRAIAVNVDDVAPVLVFADYLDEIGYKPDSGHRYDKTPKWMKTAIKNYLDAEQDTGLDNSLCRSCFPLPARFFPDGKSVDILNAFGITTAFGFRLVFASQILVPEIDAVRWWCMLGKITGGIPVLCRTTKHKHYPSDLKWLRMMLIQASQLESIQ